MKAEELRIGNYVEEKGDLYEISQVNRNGQLRLYSAKEHITSGISKIRLIPLTEEWLIKLGFRKTGDILRVSVTHHLELAFMFGELRIQTIKSGFTNYLDVKYVHQLQNVYFALTGEELTLQDA